MKLFFFLTLFALCAFAQVQVDEEPPVSVLPRDEYVDALGNGATANEAPVNASEEASLPRDTQETPARDPAVWNSDDAQSLEEDDNY